MNTEHKHTPGTWEEYFESDNWFVRSWEGTAAEGPWEICKTFKHAGYSEDGVCVTGEANARLIAAAPDLLNALKAIIFQVAQGSVLERDACITQARAAIAKAQGLPVDEPKPLVDKPDEL